MSFAASGSAAATISVTPNSGFTGTVNLTCGIAGNSGAANPPTCTVAEPAAITGSQPVTSSIAINTDATTTPGDYTLNVSGTSGQLTASTTVDMKVAPPAGGSGTGQFTMSGTAVNIPSAGGTGTSTITITPSGGFSGTVALACAITTSPNFAEDPPACSVSQPSAITGTQAVDCHAYLVYISRNLCGSPPTLPVRIRRGQRARGALPHLRAAPAAHGGLSSACSSSKLLLTGASELRRPSRRLLQCRQPGAPRPVSMLSRDVKQAVPCEAHCDCQRHGSIANFNKTFTEGIGREAHTALRGLSILRSIEYVIIWKKTSPRIYPLRCYTSTTFALAKAPFFPLSLDSPPLYSRQTTLNFRADQTPLYALLSAGNRCRGDPLHHL